MLKPDGYGNILPAHDDDAVMTEHFVAGKLADTYNTTNIADIVI